MQLHSLTGKMGKSRRVGRGGKRGKTSGRGIKGQKARAGHKIRPEARDAIKKIPKRRGYGKNRGRTVVPRSKVRALNLRDLEAAFEGGASIDKGAIMKKGLARRIDGKAPPLKILGAGELTKKFMVSGIPVSVSAKAAIEKAGGTVTI